MKQGAGFLIICPSTGRVLLALRNDPVPVWANFGGAVEKYETPLQCAKRELIEEAGFIEGTHYDIVSKIPLDISSYINFTYRCFLATMKNELMPTLNYEHTTYEWFYLDKLPENLHFGIQNMLRKDKLVGKINGHMK